MYRYIYIHEGCEFLGGETTYDHARYLVDRGHAKAVITADSLATQVYPPVNSAAQGESNALRTAV